MKHYTVHIANCFKLISYKILILIKLILQTKYLKKKHCDCTAFPWGGVIV